MEIVKVAGPKLSNEEREIHIYLDPIDRVWMLDSFMPKYFNKAIKQGWTPIRKYVYEDGTTCGMSFKGPERAITIRSVDKKQLSEKQLSNLNLCEDE